ncbi:hypothetical protein V8F44DRAFT_606595 [Aspergillus fumigatus]
MLCRAAWLRKFSPQTIRLYRPIAMNGKVIVLDSSLRICEVSDSHLSLTNLTREDIVGCGIFDIPLSTIPVSSLPVLLGAIRIAVSTKARH